jgi:subtilase family protein
MTQRESRRRGIGAAFTAAVLGFSLAALPSTANAAPAPPPDTGNLLGKQDRDLLIQARQDGESTVTALVIAKDGQTSQSIDQLKGLGAKIEFHADRVGYVRAQIPTDKVEKAAGLSAIEGFDLNRFYSLGEPRPAGIQNPSPQPAPGANTPSVNPYMPTGDTGAAQFVEQNPKFDGRGTTVGIIDTGVDLGHPALTTTSTGESKIVDWVTTTTPDDGDPTWIDMSNPAPGQPSQFRFGLFDERDPNLAGELGNDVNRDGNPAGSIGTFGVLWDTATNTVWVDTNQNKNFADELAMTDYKVQRDQGEFGEDDPSTPVRESMPFVVQTDPANDRVNIGIVSGEHGSHVAGIVAGNKLFGGAVNGAAPGAKLLSVRVCLFVAGCSRGAMDEGMIYAASHGVDVINMSIGGLGALNDIENGQDTDSQTLYNRLIDEYGVQILISAGNDGPGQNTVSDPSLATKVMSVGSYISKASWQRNYGSDAAQEDNLHPFSSRGPTEEGAFKPDIVAPGSAISTIPTWMPGGPVAGTYALPPGYAMLQGTSMASPQAAGAGALLYSAAKQKNVSHRPEQVRQAFKSSARFLTNYQAYEQGNGLIDVKKAWNLLKADIRTTSITSSVPVHTVLSDFLTTPGVGLGIHDREGVKAGDRYVREYTFKRTSGASSPQTYKVDWVGNDGTFSSPSTILLPLNSAVKFRVTVNPQAAGAHSAILNLDSPLSTGIEYQTLNTVVAAEDFTSANGFQIRHGGLVARNDWESYFVRVPANTPALKVDLQGGGTTPGAGQIRFLRYHPYGTAFESNTQTTNCYNPPVPPGNACNAGDSPTSRTASNPTAGVWEIVVEARRTSDVAKAPYTLTVSVLGATVSPNPDTIPSAQLNQPVSRQYTLTNSLGPFTGRAVGSNLGSAHVERPTIAQGQQVRFPITVAAGATQIRAKIGNPADRGADLDLGLYRCTTGSCLLVASSADGDSEEAVALANPTPGQWEVRVTGFAVPAGTTAYDYLDVFSGPAFGNVAVTDANAPRAAGSSWTVTGVVTAKTVPAAGRVLLGSVEVRTDSNILVGSGDVVIQSVS